MAKVYYIPTLSKKEAREEIIGKILLKEFKNVEIKDENMFIYFDVLSNTDAGFMGNVDLKKAKEKSEKIKDKLLNSKEPMFVALPLEYKETLEIIKQKRMLNPNAVIKEVIKMYKPEITLKATDKLKKQIKSDFEKWKEWIEKSKEYLKKELKIQENILDIYPSFETPRFWVKLDKNQIESFLGKPAPQGVITLDMVKAYYSKINPIIKVIGVEEVENGFVADLTVDRRTKQAKDFIQKWQKEFKDYEKPVNRYLLGDYLPSHLHKIHFHQVNEEDLVIFLTNNKKHIAEELIKTGDWEITYLKTIKNPPNYGKSFNEELKKLLNQ